MLRVGGGGGLPDVGHGAVAGFPPGVMHFVRYVRGLWVWSFSGGCRGVTTFLLCLTVR